MRPIRLVLRAHGLRSYSLKVNWGFYPAEVRYQKEGILR